MPWNICDICMVSLHCEFCCVYQDCQPVWIVCYKHYIQTVYLQNDFVCVLLGLYYSDNTCHILCTCIYQCEYTCADSVHHVMKSISHTESTNTSIQCVCSCETSYVFLLRNVCHTLYTHMDVASHHCHQLWY